MKDKHNNDIKRPYETPKLEKVEIDNEISLLMMTDQDNPPDPGGDPGGGDPGIW